MGRLSVVRQIWKRARMAGVVLAGLALGAGWMRAQTPAPASDAAPAKVAAFEVASVRPASDATGAQLNIPQGTQMTERNISLWLLLQLAFGVEQNQIVGPEWMMSETYDIVAKTENGVSLTKEQMQPLVQRLLVDRFGLKYHHETREMNGYALVVAKGGPKMPAAKEGASKGGNIMFDSMRVPSATMQTVAALMAIVVHQPVVDKTGVTGAYEIKLSFAPDGAKDSNLPSVYTALQEQLGLKLEAQKVPVEMLVIDHVEKVPTEN